MATHTKRKVFSVLRNTKRTAGVFKNLAKESMKNLGRVARKLTAGYAKDPITGTVAIASQAIPVPGASGVALAATPTVSKAVLPNKTRKNLRRLSRSIMDNSGSTKGSRIGQKLEYNVNRGMLGLSKMSQYLPM